MSANCRSKDHSRSVRVGKVDGKLIAFPTNSELEESELDMIVSGSRSEVAMIEGFAHEMPEDEMMEAIQFAHNVIREVIDLQDELYQKVNPTKKAVHTARRRRIVPAFE